MYLCGFIVLFVFFCLFLFREIKVHYSVRKETTCPCFQLCRFFGTFNLFNRNKTMCKVHLCFCSTIMCGNLVDFLIIRTTTVQWISGLAPHVCVKSLLADVHTILSLLGGRWEIFHLSATFLFPVDIKLPPCSCCLCLSVCVVLCVSSSLKPSWSHHGHAQSVFLPQAVWRRKLESKRGPGCAVCRAVPDEGQVSLGLNVIYT